MSGFITPQLCMRATEEHVGSLDPGDWVTEPKHDGWRGQLVVDREGGGCIYSRRGKSFLGKAPHIDESLRWLPAGTVIDGEFIIISEWATVQGERVPVADFNRAQRALGSLPAQAVVKQASGGRLCYVAFDCLRWDGSDVSGQQWGSRRRYVESAVEVMRCDDVRLQPAWWKYPDGMLSLYHELLDAGVEGIVAKRKLAGYNPGGRGSEWLKLKGADTKDVVLMGVTPGQGKYAGPDWCGAFEYGAHDEQGTLRRVGTCSGMTDKIRHEVAIDVKSYVGRPFTIRAWGLVGSGRHRTPRHAQFAGWRDPADKPARECLLSQFEVSVP